MPRLQEFPYSINGNRTGFDEWYEISRSTTVRGQVNERNILCIVESATGGCRYNGNYSASGKSMSIVLELILQLRRIVQLLLANLLTHRIERIMTSAFEKAVTILACPRCKQPITYDSHEIRCQACHEAFSVHSGLPILVDNTSEVLQWYHPHAGGARNSRPAWKRIGRALLDALTPEERVWTRKSQKVLDGALRTKNPGCARKECHSDRGWIRVRVHAVIATLLIVDTERTRSAR